MPGHLLGPARIVPLARLPAAGLGAPDWDADPAWRLAAAFLLGYRGHARRTYFAAIDGATAPLIWAWWPRSAHPNR